MSEFNREMNRRIDELDKEDKENADKVQTKQDEQDHRLDDLEQENH